MMGKNEMGREIKRGGDAGVYFDNFEVYSLE